VGKYEDYIKEFRREKDEPTVEMPASIRAVEFIRSLLEYPEVRGGSLSDLRQFHSIFDCMNTEFPKYINQGFVNFEEVNTLISFAKSAATCFGNPLFGTKEIADDFSSLAICLGQIDPVMDLPAQAYLSLRNISRLLDTRDGTSPQ